MPYAGICCVCLLMKSEMRAQVSEIIYRKESAILKSVFYIVDAENL